ncbi:hypothetical protein NT6N_19670 [Oceaniferula spumae]|uniref:PPM-type phosphatase domain-containing protein n=1 Tax=Oceaniferula spumae TaxID=2979115 RepID=A0AAT9FLU7_9BACT
MLKIDQDFAGRQIPGDRPYQEDAQGFASLVENSESEVEVLLVVLADGMGGENAGDHASSSVVLRFVEFCHEFESTDRMTMQQMLLCAMNTANNGLAADIETDPMLEGMGTTILAAVVSQDSLYWLSVGDSPLYLYRDGCLEQLNEDHSMMPLLERQVEDGFLHESQLATHPERNVLRAALTGEEITLVDCPQEGFRLLPGDVVIVASDGIQTLDEEQILDCIEKNLTLTADEITRELIEAVKAAAKPRQDNASINVIRIPN